MPPDEVVPYRDPLYSSRPEVGKPPSVAPLKVYSTVSFPDGSSLKTTPHPEEPNGHELLVLPPPPVVPYRLPAGSPMRGLPPGPEPSGAPLKEYTVSSVDWPP